MKQKKRKQKTFKPRLPAACRPVRIHRPGKGKGSYRRKGPIRVWEWQ